MAHGKHRRPSLITRIRTQREHDRARAVIKVREARLRRMVAQMYRAVDVSR